VEAELVSLASSGATALVGLMVSDGWAQVKERVATLLARGARRDRTRAEPAGPEGQGETAGAVAHEEPAAVAARADSAGAVGRQDPAGATAQVAARGTAQADSAAAAAWGEPAGAAGEPAGAAAGVEPAGVVVRVEPAGVVVRAELAGLEESREELLVARDAGDEALAGDVEASLRTRLRRALRADPSLADELRALLEELAPSDPADVGGAVHNVISGGVQHGTVIQGRDFTGGLTFNG
jgi:hypothetical protein